MAAKLRATAVCMALLCVMLLAGCEFEADVDEPDSRTNAGSDNLAMVVRHGELA